VVCEPFEHASRRKRDNSRIFFIAAPILLSRIAIDPLLFEDILDETKINIDARSSEGANRKGILAYPSVLYD